MMLWYDPIKDRLCLPSPLPHTHTHTHTLTHTHAHIHTPSFHIRRKQYISLTHPHTQIKHQGTDRLPPSVSDTHPPPGRPGQGGASPTPPFFYGPGRGLGGGSQKSEPGTNLRGKGLVTFIDMKCRLPDVLWSAGCPRQANLIRITRPCRRRPPPPPCPAPNKGHRGGDWH